MKSYKDEDSGHDYLMDPGCRAVGRPPCTRPDLGLSSPEGTTDAVRCESTAAKTEAQLNRLIMLLPEGTTDADVSPQQREPRHS